jgi:hypothetical protein
MGTYFPSVTNTLKHRRMPRSLAPRRRRIKLGQLQKMSQNQQELWVFILPPHPKLIMIGMQTQGPHLIWPHIVTGRQYYSAGVGSVVFNPTIEGKKCRPVQFTRVLHVPMLRHNLLSVLFLTRQRNFKVHIDANHIHFILNGDRLFVASISDDNSAFLNGNTQSHLESAQITSTLPLNYELWHRRFAHVNHDDVKKLISQNLVTGLKLDSKPDPICEPCHRNEVLCLIHRW